MIQPMTVVYYNFYLNMWVMNKITAEVLQAKVPKYISQDEYDMIVATPQMED